MFDWGVFTLSGVKAEEKRGNVFHRNEGTSARDYDTTSYLSSIKVENITTSKLSNLS
jgi:hypothetical protein